MISTNVRFENNNLKKSKIKNGVRINLDIYMPYFKKTKEVNKVTLFPTETRASNNFDISKILENIESEINDKAYNTANKIVNYDKEQTKRFKKVPTILNINIFGGFYSLMKQEKEELLDGLLNIKLNAEKEIKNNLEYKFKRFKSKPLVSLNLEYPLEEISDIVNSDDKKLEFKSLIKKYSVNKLYLEIYSTNKFLNQSNGLKYTENDIKSVIKYLNSNSIKYGIKTYLDIFDSYTQDYVENMENILYNYSRDIIISIVNVVKDSGLEKKAIEKKYVPLKNVEIVQLLSNIDKAINKCKFKKIEYRFAHEPTLYADKYVAGPYMVDLNEMIESNIWYEKIIDCTKNLKSKDKKVSIFTEKENIPKIQGKNFSNLKKIKQLYDVNIELFPYENLKFLDKFKVRKAISRNGLSIKVVETFND